MGRIEKNHWFVKENELSISLMKFHVGIRQITKEEENITYWQIVITNSDMDKLYMNFATLEDCIYFTENYISKAWDFNEIMEKKKEYRKEKQEIKKTKEKVLELYSNNNKK